MWFPQYGAPLIQWYYYAIISFLTFTESKKSKHDVMFSFKFVFYFVLYK